MPSALTVEPAAVGGWVLHAYLISASGNRWCTGYSMFMRRSLRASVTGRCRRLSTGTGIRVREDTCIQSREGGLGGVADDEAEGVVLHLEWRTPGGDRSVCCCGLAVSKPEFENVYIKEKTLYTLHGRYMHRIMASMPPFSA